MLLFIIDCDPTATDEPIYYPSFADLINLLHLLVSFISHILHLLHTLPLLPLLSFILTISLYYHPPIFDCLHLILVFHLMGQKQPKTIIDELTIIDKDWLPSKYENDTWILTNSRTNLEAEQHLLTCDPNQTVEHELEIYHYRQTQTNALVSVYGAEHMQKKEAPLCGNLQTMKVITERIPRRLSHLPELSFPEALYFISQSFRGFKDCFEKVGLFEITEDMIGVNNEGEVKVWLNQNFECNHPPSERPYLQITSSPALRQANDSHQHQMIEKVMHIIEKKTEQGRLPSSLRARLKSSQTFVEAYCELQDYCKQKGIWIPDRLPSNSMIIQQKKMESRGRSSKMSEFKDYIRHSREGGNSIMNSPHASYVPNVQYCEPRMTYVQSENRRGEGEYMQSRTIQVDMVVENRGNRGSRGSGMIQSPGYRGSEKVQSPGYKGIQKVQSPVYRGKEGRPFAFVFPDNHQPNSPNHAFMTSPQSPKIHFLSSGRSTPCSNKN